MEHIQLTDTYNAFAYMYIYIYTSTLFVSVIYIYICSPMGVELSGEGIVG